MPIIPARFWPERISDSVKSWVTATKATSAPLIFWNISDKIKKPASLPAISKGLRTAAGSYELAKKISKQKPIIIWKGGLTETGARAALAHTGALAGSRQVWEAMFKQAGIISVNSIEEVADCVLAFYRLPLPKGKRVAILSGMAGTNVGTADNCLMMGLEMAKYSENTNQRLSKILPAIGTTAANPTDIGAGVW